MIDKHGKIFGKINLIDLMVLIVVVAIIAVVAWRMFMPEAEAVLPSTTTITYTVDVDDVSPEIYESILLYMPNCQLMASGQLISAYITDVTAEVQQTPVTALYGDTLVINMEDDELLTLTFTITAEINDTILTEVGTQEVRIGRTHIIKTAYFELSSGVITSCIWE